MGNYYPIRICNNIKFGLQLSETFGFKMMSAMNYKEPEIIRSKRKTFSIEVRRDGKVTVRVPLRASLSDIRSFIEKNEGWVKMQLKKLEDIPESDILSLSENEIRYLSNEAKRYIPGKVAYYAQKIGVTYGRITIRHQRTRWGSCSAKGNLNFNCLLMLAPPQVIDSVIVHELCHIKHMNHSKKFYDEVLKAYPEYFTWDKWLKENGRRYVITD